MKTKNKKSSYACIKLAWAIMLVFSGLGIACENNFDCQIGSKCIKSGGPFNPGVCMGGMNPGNSYDSKPVYNPYNSSDKIGNTCSWDSDCGIGRRCFKDGMYGVCQ